MHLFILRVFEAFYASCVRPDLAPAFPKILTPENIRNADGIKHQDMMRYIEGSRPVTRCRSACMFRSRTAQSKSSTLSRAVAVCCSDVIVGSGYKSVSDWWVYFNTTVHCVARLTGMIMMRTPCLALACETLSGLFSSLTEVVWYFVCRLRSRRHPMRRPARLSATHPGPLQAGPHRKGGSPRRRSTQARQARNSHSPPCVRSAAGRW
jgi:hypothetical protein